MKTILILVIVVALMGASAFFVAKMVILPKMGPGGAESVEQADESEGDGEGEETEGEVYLVENILVNPKGTGGTRYLSTSLGLEVRTPEAVAKLQSRDLQVRDLLNSILAARTVPQLTDPAEREAMRKEILARLQKMLGGDEPSAVYFVDYVMQ